MDRSREQFEQRADGSFLSRYLNHEGPTLPHRLASAAIEDNPTIFDPASAERLYESLRRGLEAEINGAAS